MAEQVLENVCSLTAPPQAEGPWQGSRSWPGIPATPAAWAERRQDFLHGWQETFAEALTKLREALAAQFRAGLKAVEVGLHAATARGPEEYRARLAEYWQQGFDCLRPMIEVPLQAARFAAALGLHFAGGSKTVSEEAYQERLAVCAACDFFQNNHCTKCGCRVTGEVVAKARWESETCPLGRWEQPSVGKSMG
jgi:hypothetical protein